MTENQRNELLDAYAKAEYYSDKSLDVGESCSWETAAVARLRIAIRSVLLIDGLYGSAFDQEIAQRRMLQGTLNSEPLNAA